MMFILRALFWLAVVAAFAPPGFTAAGTLFADEAQRVLTPAAERLSGQVEADAGAFCAEQTEACVVAENARALSGLVGGMAANAALDAARADAGVDARPAAETRGADALDPI